MLRTVILISHPRSSAMQFLSINNSYEKRSWSPLQTIRTFHLFSPLSVSFKPQFVTDTNWLPLFVFLTSLFSSSSSSCFFERKIASLSCAYTPHYSARVGCPSFLSFEALKEYLLCCSVDSYTRHTCTITKSHFISLYFLH